MASSAESPTFHLFSNFPVELRLKIWREAMPELDDILVHGYKKGCWGVEQHSEARSNGLAYSSASPDLIFNFRHELLDDVQIDVPIVFVNREARGAVLSWAHQQGIKMRFIEERQCHVFVVPFDPLRDALFVNRNLWEEFCLEPVGLLGRPDIQGKTLASNSELTQIALPHTALSPENSIFYDILHWFPHLQVLFVIVDIDIGLRPADLATMAAKQRAKLRMKHQRWTVSETQGHAFVWNTKDDKFEWRTGTPIGPRSMYSQIEEKALGVAEMFAQRTGVSFEIQPVLMLGAQ